MTFQLVHELLFVEPVKFLRNKSLIASQSGNDAMLQSETVKVIIYLIRTTTNYPALCQQFLNFFGITHDGKTAAVEEVAKLTPRQRFASFSQDSDKDNLDVGQPQPPAKISHRILDGTPEFIREFAVTCLVENPVQSGDNSPFFRFYIRFLFFLKIMVAIIAIKNVRAVTVYLKFSHSRITIFINEC